MGYRRWLALAVTSSAALLLVAGAPASASTGDAAVPAMSHVFVVIGENTQLSQINAGNSPYLLGTLKPDSAWLTDYWATTHYSESNYVAMTSGQFTKCEQKDGSVASCHQT